MTGSKQLYQVLLTRPKNFALMAVLADKLSDEGHPLLATAYRWAAARGKWPFSRNEFRGDRLLIPSTTVVTVYDWDSEHRTLVPAESRLPRPLYDALRELEGRKYADVNQAFVLLANILANNKQYRSIGPERMMG